MGQERTVSLKVLAEMEAFARDFRQKFPKATEKAVEAATAKMQSVYIRQANKRIKLAERTARKVADIQKVVVGGAMAFVAQQAAKITFAGLKSASQDLMDARNQVNDLAGAIGQSNEQLQAFGFAARLSGGSLRELEPSLKGFPKRLDDMARGSGEARTAFLRLGITSKDAAAALREGRDITGDVIDKLQSMENATQRAAFASMIFGESGTRLLKVLGDKSLEDWVELTQRYAVDVGPAAVEASQRWEAASGMLEGTFVKFKETLFDAAGGTESMVKVSAFLAGTLASLGQIVGLSADAFKVFTERISLSAAAVVAYAQNDIPTLLRIFGRLKNSEIPELGRKLAAVWTSGRDTYKQFIEDVDAYTVATQRNTQAVEELAKAQAKIKSFLSEIEKVADAQDRLATIARTAGRDQLKGIDAVRAKYDQHYDAIGDLVAKNLVTLQEAGAAYVALEERVQRDVSEIHEKANKERADNMADALAMMRDALFEFASVVADIFVSMNARRLEDNQKTIDEIKSRRERLADRIAQIEDGAAKEDKERTQKILGLHLDAARQEQKELRRGAIEAAVGAKALGVTQTTVAGIVAGMQAFAQLGPIAGAIAAAAIAVATAGSVAAIIAQPLPSFFRGGGVRGKAQAAAMAGDGSQLAMLHDGERVLNSRAVSQLGDGIIDAINAGLGGAVMGGGGDTYLDGELLARSMADRIRRPGELRTAVTEASNTGRRLVYRE